jgi:hypothetical protein
MNESKSTRERFEERFGFLKEAITKLGNNQVIDIRSLDGLAEKFFTHLESEVKLAEEAERARIDYAIIKMMPILWHDDPNRHLENVARSNALDEVRALLSQGHIEELK